MRRRIKEERNKLHNISRANRYKLILGIALQVHAKKPMTETNSIVKIQPHSSRLSVRPNDTICVNTNLQKPEFTLS